MPNFFGKIKTISKVSFPNVSIGNLFTERVKFRPKDFRNGNLGQIFVSPVIKIITIFFIFYFSLNSFAETKNIPRKILALYKGSENRTEEINEISQMAQLPLNNLGFVVEYKNAETELPDLQDLEDYRGVLTWFVSDQMINAHEYRIWLYQVLEKLKLPVIILGHLGAYREHEKVIKNSDILETQAIFNSLGLTSSLQGWSSEAINIEEKNLSYFDFEAKLAPSSLKSILDVCSNDPRNKVLLGLTDKDRQNDAAVIMPNGAYIQSEVIYKQINKNGENQWYLNPLKLFSKVFSCESVPSIEINNIGGKRTAFIHVDGDGFSTISKIDRWHLCAQLLQSRIINQYPLPYSVSIIAAEIDTNYMGTEETLKAARELFGQPNVEAASHGFAHPFDWRTGELELDSIPNYSFNPNTEIKESVQFIQNNLLPSKKSVNLFFWSGMCNPTSEQIQIAREANLLQINGRAGKINPDYPSISAFAPPYSQVNNQFKINARISNEYEFTNLWNGPYDGYKDILKSIEFTDAAQLIPADLYFHFYSLEFNESWKALRDVIKYASHQNWNFLYTSQYVRMVKDFLKAEIVQTDKNNYFVKSEGFVRTIRFPNEKRTLNLAKSENLLGFTYSANDLLIHLNSQKSHKIVFTKQSGKKTYLESFNRMVDSFTEKENQFQINVYGYGNFNTTIKNLPTNQAYEIDIFSSLEKKNYQQNDIPNIKEIKSNKNYDKFYAKSSGDGSLKLETFISNRTIIKISPTDPFNLKLARVKYLALGLVLVVFLSGQLVIRKRR